eukprot:CAMPEP_0179946426 /NCGR_PEP_ID=MMETSP0983-20121128/20360_1 /TAXON_ID=483367 /ORGANISM="non described non described, Strain CCMP 2436" /LENGTH=110 /DNA_ID=CAMNT_0021855227 /DNA_START=248 /DNA_END=577 /DNA_ORIENTATION=-
MAANFACACTRPARCARTRASSSCAFATPQPPLPRGRRVTGEYKRRQHGGGACARRAAASPACSPPPRPLTCAQAVARPLPDSEKCASESAGGSSSRPAPNSPSSESSSP